MLLGAQPKPGRTKVALTWRSALLERVVQGDKLGHCPRHSLRSHVSAHMPSTNTPASEDTVRGARLHRNIMFNHAAYTMVKWPSNASWNVRLSTEEARWQACGGMKHGMS